MTAPRLTAPTAPVREPRRNAPPEVSLLSGLASVRQGAPTFAPVAGLRQSVHPRLDQLVVPVECRRPDKLAWRSLGDAAGFFATLDEEQRRRNELYPCGAGPVHWHLGRPYFSDTRPHSETERVTLDTYERLVLERLGEVRS